MTDVERPPASTSDPTRVVREGAQPYDEAVCPLPGCGKPLHIGYSVSRPVFLGDTVADLGPEGGYTQSWSVECEGDHRILNPPDTAEDSYLFGRCAIGEAGEHEEGDDLTWCPCGDLDRLRAVIGDGEYRP